MTPERREQLRERIRRLYQIANRLADDLEGNVAARCALELAWRLRQELKEGTLNDQGKEADVAAGVDSGIRSDRDHTSIGNRVGKDVPQKQEDNRA